MLVPWVPTETVCTHHTCRYHERHPGKSYAGCTCSGSYTARRKNADEWTREECQKYLLSLAVPADVMEEMRSRSPINRALAKAAAERMKCKKHRHPGR